MTDNSPIEELGKNILREKKIIGEINSLFNYLKNADNPEEKRMIFSQIRILTDSIQKTGQKIINSVEAVSLTKPLYSEQKISEESPAQLSQQTPLTRKDKKLKTDSLEKLALKRIKKKKKTIVKKKEKKPSKYVKFSSKLFYDLSMSFINKGFFRELKRDLIKSNMNFVPATYVSVIFFTTLVSLIASFLITLFFLFFNLSALPPFIIFIKESIGARFLKVFWILFAIPIITFMFVYFYPSFEKKSLENKINRELPFAAIHMSSIAGSMIEPSKIFNIIISTKEYPNLEKEFIKLQNEINIYGYDLVTALRNRSFNSPSRKLSDLFNGVAITITSGGDLAEFFEKRSESLLFEHRLDMEKQLKASETFMDIYISIVIAAPMVLMLVLMMMRISGLGIALSPFMISFVMILAVSVINIFFLAFLHIKQPKT